MKNPDPRRVYQQVVLRLAEKINSGEIPDGSLLPSERQLMEMFGVSRTAVREAMAALQGSGLIAVRPNRRALVTRLNSTGFFNLLTSAALSLMARPGGMSDFQEARTLFECGIARHAARYASPKEIERLRSALEQNREAVGDLEMFAQTGLAFHRILAEIPRNPIFTACHAAISEWMVLRRTQILKGRPPEMSQAVFQRREAVYRAIVARDVEAADQAMASHLEFVNALYAEIQDAMAVREQ